MPSGRCQVRVGYQTHRYIWDEQKLFILAPGHNCSEATFFAATTMIIVTVIETQAQTTANQPMLSSTHLFHGLPVSAGILHLPVF